MKKISIELGFFMMIWTSRIKKRIAINMDKVKIWKKKIIKKLNHKFNNLIKN